MYSSVNGIRSRFSNIDIEESINEQTTIIRTVFSTFENNSKVIVSCMKDVRALLTDLLPARSAPTAPHSSRTRDTSPIPIVISPSTSPNRAAPPRTSTSKAQSSQPIIISPTKSTQQSQTITASKTSTTTVTSSCTTPTPLPRPPATQTKLYSDIVRQDASEKDTSATTQNHNSARTAYSQYQPPTSTIHVQSSSMHRRANALNAANSDPSDTTFTAVVRKRKTTYYVGNLNPQVSYEDIAKYVDTNNLGATNISIYRGRTRASFRANFPSEKEDIIESPDTWPPHVVVRRWKSPTDGQHTDATTNTRETHERSRQPRMYKYGNKRDNFYASNNNEFELPPRPHNYDNEQSVGYRDYNTQISPRPRRYNAEHSEHSRNYSAELRPLSQYRNYESPVRRWNDHDHDKTNNDREPSWYERNLGAWNDNTDLES